MSVGSAVTTLNWESVLVDVSCAPSLLRRLEGGLGAALRQEI